MMKVLYRSSFLIYFFVLLLPPNLGSEDDEGARSKVENRVIEIIGEAAEANNNPVHDTGTKFESKIVGDPSRLLPGISGSLSALHSSSISTAQAPHSRRKRQNFDGAPSLGQIFRGALEGVDDVIRSTRDFDVFQCVERMFCELAAPLDQQNLRQEFVSPDQLAAIDGAGGVVQDPNAISDLHQVDQFNQGGQQFAGQQFAGQQFAGQQIAGQPLQPLVGAAPIQPFVYPFQFGVPAFQPFVQPFQQFAGQPVQQPVSQAAQPAVQHAATEQVSQIAAAPQIPQQQYAAYPQVAQAGYPFQPAAFYPYQQYAFRNVQQPQQQPQQVQSQQEEQPQHQVPTASAAERKVGQSPPVSHHWTPQTNGQSLARSPSPYRMRYKIKRRRPNNWFTRIFGRRKKRDVKEVEEEEVNTKKALSRVKRNLLNTIFRNANGKNIVNALDRMMENQDNSLYSYTRAALMGYTGEARTCQQLYTNCPTNSDELIDVFNNLNHYFPQGIPLKEKLPFGLGFLLP